MGEVKARVEYLRALRYELRALPPFDQVQVCTPAQRDYLLEFRPALAPKLRAGLRAGIDTSRYEFRPTGREPLTMLFIGSFRHDPNRVALDWFVREVLPADSAARAARAAGGRGFGTAARPRLCRLRREPRHARLRGGHSRTAGEVRGFRLPHPERIGRARKAARSFCRRNSGCLDVGRRGGSRKRGRRHLRAGRRSGAVRRARAGLVQELRMQRLKWRRGRARKWKPTGTWRRSRASWWKDTTISPALSVLIRSRLHPSCRADYENLGSQVLSACRTPISTITYISSIPCL